MKAKSYLNEFGPVSWFVCSGFLCRYVSQVKVQHEPTGPIDIWQAAKDENTSPPGNWRMGGY